MDKGSFVCADMLEVGHRLHIASNQLLADI